MRDVHDERAMELSGVGKWLVRVTKLLGLVVAATCLVGLSAIFLS